MTRFSLSTLLAGIIVLGGGLAFAQQKGATKTPSADAAGKKLDLTLIPADAVAALVAQPRRVLTSPQAELWPTEILSAVGKKELGFDPLEIEQVVVVIGLPKNGPEPRYGLIFRFSKPLDTAAVLAKIVTPRGKDADIQGKKARIAELPFEPSGVAVADGTLLFAPEADLEWCMSAARGDSPLRTLLAGADDSPDAAVYVAVEPLRPLLRPMFQQLAAEMHPPLFELTKIPEAVETLDTLQLRARLSDGGVASAKLELALGTLNVVRAAELARLLKQSAQTFKQTIVAQMAQNMDGDPEITEASVKYATRISDKLGAALEPKPEGNRVVIRTEVRASMAEAGVLAALLLPTVRVARQAADWNLSQNNLKQIGLAILNYEDTKRTMPARANFDKDGKPLLSWRVHILPFIEEGPLYQEFHLDEPWDSEHNKKLIQRMPMTYRHPQFNEPGKTVYQAVVGKGLGFEGNKGLRLADLVDGTSKTILVVEAAPEKAVVWTKPDDFEPDPDNALNGLGGLDPRGVFNALFADGHVEAISLLIDPKQFMGCLTRAGGEPGPF